MVPVKITTVVRYSRSYKEFDYLVMLRRPARGSWNGEWAVRDDTYVQSSRKTRAEAEQAVKDAVADFKKRFCEVTE